MSTYLASARTGLSVSNVVHTCRLPDDNRAAKALRDWIARVLTSRQMRLLGEELALVATEIATNAVRHGSAPARVWLSVTDDGGVHVRLEVVDSGPGFDPHTIPTASVAALECHGRGLRIVDALARSWGNARVGDGHLVWAELAKDPA